MLEKTTLKETQNPREAAFLALLNLKKNDIFLSHSLDIWQKATTPSTKNFHLAKDLSFGTCRMMLALDELAKKLAKKGHLSLKLKEKILCRMTIYQYYYQDNIPLYAIGQEMGELAKKYTHPYFSKFLNAIIRQLGKEQKELTLKNHSTAPEMSLHFSYPLFFVTSLIDEMNDKKAMACMELQNKPAALMFRIRDGGLPIIPEDGIEILSGTTTPIGICHDKNLLPSIVESPFFYMQNATQITLLDRLISKTEKVPKKILDLCASPGGKSIGLHDAYKESSLFVNDVSPQKILKLRENLDKYSISATISEGKGEMFDADETFDLILIDAPCSNSGVLNKRPEARWRISKKEIELHTELQLNLIRHATKLLNPKGMIWYMTCSILKDENISLVKRAEELLPLKLEYSEQILPTEQGFDGGFCALLINTNND